MRSSSGWRRHLGSAATLYPCVIIVETVHRHNIPKRKPEIYHTASIGFHHKIHLVKFQEAVRNIILFSPSFLLLRPSTPHNWCGISATKSTSGNVMPINVVVCSFQLTVSAFWPLEKEMFVNLVQLLVGKRVRVALNLSNMVAKI